MHSTEVLTEEERGQLEKLVRTIKEGELAQVNDLLMNCGSPHQFAKTHSVYVKDWEKTKQRMEGSLNDGVLPPGVSSNFQRALIDALDKVMEVKLETIRSAFQMKFGESIYNYLGKDGKTKSIFGF